MGSVVCMACQVRMFSAVCMMCSMRGGVCKMSLVCT